MGSTARTQRPKSTTTDNVPTRRNGRPIATAILHTTAAAAPAKGAQEGSTNRIESPKSAHRATIVHATAIAVLAIHRPRVPERARTCVTG